MILTELFFQKQVKNTVTREEEKILSMSREKMV